VAFLCGSVENLSVYLPYHVCLFEKLLSSYIGPGDVKQPPRCTADFNCVHRDIHKKDSKVISLAASASEDSV